MKNFTELAIPVEDCVEALELVLFGEVEKVGVIIGGVTSLVVGLGEGDGVVGGGPDEGDGDGVFGLGDGDGVVGGGLGEGDGVAGGVDVDVWTGEFGDVVEGPGLPIDVTIVPIPVPLETSKVQTPFGQHSHGAWLPRLS